MRWVLAALAISCAFAAYALAFTPMAGVSAAAEVEEGSSADPSRVEHRPPIVATPGSGRTVASSTERREGAPEDRGAAPPRRELLLGLLAQPSEDPVNSTEQPEPSERLPERGSTLPARHELERRFELERNDPSWTEETQTYTLEALADAKLAPDHIASVDCRTTLCRVELEFDTSAQAVKLYELRHPDFQMQYFVEGQHYTVYFARENALLSGSDKP